MICPRCHAEYREGFTRCKDCNVDLLAALPAGEVTEVSLGESKSQGRFLAWFGPMAVFYLLTLLLMAVPNLARNQYVLLFAFVWSVTPALGACWMLYQVIRFEKEVFPLAVFALVPFAFVWYYMERYRRRLEKAQVPPALR